MKVIRGIQQLPAAAQGCVLTLGNYDGVHKGHQAVLSRLAEQAKALNAPLVVMCFEPTPLEFFSPNEAPVRLTVLREKAQLLAEQGVDFLVVQQFNQPFASLSAAEFIQTIVVEALAAKSVVIGDDFRFGAGREGDVAVLRKAGTEYGFEVLDTSTVASEQGRVSSTAVRACLAACDLNAAEALLGRPYSMEGRVVHGDKLGRELGFPTANISFRRAQLPLQGVYAVKVYGVADCDEPYLAGVANLGTRPAVNGVEPRLEVHLLDWKGDLYGQRLRVEFIGYVRSEQRFACLEELIAAIADDVAQAGQFFE